MGMQSTGVDLFRERTRVRGTRRHYRPKQPGRNHNAAPRCPGLSSTFVGSELLGQKDTVPQ